MTVGFLVFYKPKYMREYIKFKKHLENFNQEFIQEKLNEGLTIQMISPLVNIPNRRLGEMIKYFNLSVVNKNTTHIVNHNYFDNIDTEEKAYFLGFLVADGCVTKDVRKSGFLSKRITFCNSIWDKEIIEKFRDIICPTIEVKWQNKSTDTIKRRDQSSFKFTSEHMFDILVNKYGINERKTHDTEFKMTDLGEYTRHFIRGFMDGDGHFRGNSLGFIYTSIPFMTQIKNFFESLGFSTRYNKVEGKTINYFKQYINLNKSNIQQIYTILYKDATVFLERKRSKFEDEIINRYKLELPVI